MTPKLDFFFSETKRGKFLLFDNCDGCYDLDYYGERAEQEFELLEQVLRIKEEPRDLNIIDVGGWVGYHAVVFSEWCRGGMLIVIEPQELLCNVLGINLAMNAGATKRTVVRAFAGKENGTITGYINDFYTRNECGDGRGGFITGSATYSYSLAMSIPSELKEKASKIHVVKIDDLATDKRIDLIKIDAEGHSLEVLEGAKKTIERCRPVLYVEAPEPTMDGVKEVVKSVGKGYKCKLHNYHVFRENNYRGMPERDFWLKGYHETMILCLPK